MLHRHLDRPGLVPHHPHGLVVASWVHGSRLVSLHNQCCRVVVALDREAWGALSSGPTRPKIHSRVVPSIRAEANLRSDHGDQIGSARDNSSGRASLDPRNRAPVRCERGRDGHHD